MWVFLVSLLWLIPFVVGTQVCSLDCDLQALLNQGASKILLNKDVEVSIPLVVSRPIVLQGLFKDSHTRFTISPSSTGIRLMDVFDDLEVENIDFVDASVGGFGGAIRVWEGSLHVQDCEVCSGLLEVCPL